MGVNDMSANRCASAGVASLQAALAEVGGFGGVSPLQGEFRVAEFSHWTGFDEKEMEVGWGL